MNQSPSSKAKLSGKSLVAGLLLASLCLLGSGCDMKLPPMPWDPKPKPTATEGADGAEAGSEGEGGGAEAPTPINELDFLPPDMKKLPFEEVNITLNDGMVIYGRLYDPGQKLDTGDDASAETDQATGDSSGDGEYKGPKYPLVILLHGIDRDHTTWSDLPVSLVKAGYSVFAMDLRGHGKSTSTTHRNRVTWRLFQPDQWLLLPKDVDQIIQHFQKDEDHPQIDGKTVALIGEKLGANVAVFSGRDTSAVKALVLISPGLNYKGLIPSQAIIDYTNPALLITTQDDQYSYKSTERLYNWLLGVKALQVYKKIGDGSDMLSHQSALGENITDWLINQMPSPERPKPVEKQSEPVPEKAGEKSPEPNGTNKPQEVKATKPAPSTPPKSRVGHADKPSTIIKPAKPAKVSSKPHPAAKEKPKMKDETKPEKATASEAKPVKKAEPATDKQNAGRPPVPGG